MIKKVTLDVHSLKITVCNQQREKMLTSEDLSLEELILLRNEIEGAIAALEWHNKLQLGKEVRLVHGS